MNDSSALGQSGVRYGLRWRLLALTLIPMLATIGVVLGFDYQNRSQLAHQALERRTFALISSLHHDISRLAFEPEREIALDMVRRLESFSDIERLYAFEHGGAVLFAYQTAGWSGREPPSFTERMVVRDVEDYLEIWAPVGKVGFVYALVNTLTVKEAQVSARQTSLSLGFLLTLVGLIGVLIIQRKVIRRILTLEQTALDVVASGDYTIRAETLPADELGTIASGLNSLLATVQKNMGELLDREKRLLNEIEERQRAEGELAKVADALDQCLEGISLTDEEGLIQFMNPAFETITGYSLEEMRGKTHRYLKSGHVADEAYEELWHELKAGRTYVNTIINRRKNGEIYHDAVRISPRKVGDELVGFVTIHRDISEQIELERQLQESQRLDALGRLAGGVAHDFNNLLQVILGQATMIDEIHNTIGADLIVEAAQRAGELTAQLLSFSRKEVLEIGDVDIRALLAELSRLLERVIPSTIEVEINVTPDLWLAKADSGRLQQVLLNLAINARDAMPNGGNLSIEARNLEVRATDQLVEYCQILVKDNGLGMDVPTLKLALDPFFTTKGDGGTGLGLSVAYGIIKQFGGSLVLSSSPEQGTVAEIRIPRSPSECMDPSKQSGGWSKKAVATTVLLVDDEDMVLAVTERILTTAGYQVLTASSGEAARAQWRTNRSQIGLLVSDVVMPKQSGVQLARKLREECADLPVILVSGHIADESIREFAKEGPFEFLNKPFGPKDFLRSVDALLDVPPAIRLIH